MEVIQSGPQDQQAIHVRGERYRARVRELNDAFRQRPEQGMGVTNKLLVTKGVTGLGFGDMFAILQRVKTFDDFGEDNDPWSEHDFGAFDHNGERIYWKIDYYDRACAAGSPNPADPSVTCRVLTVMLVSEY